MPATEQTWRESKLLHLVFGLSALGMLVATVWMLAADHRREWKDYRQKFEGIEAWTTASRTWAELTSSGTTTAMSWWTGGKVVMSS